MTPEYVDLAIRATQAMELEIAGVDLLETADGPVIPEVNPSPGLDIEEVTGIKVADEMIDWAVKFAATREA